MIKLLLTVGFILAFLLLVELRYTVFHLFTVLSYAIRDTYKYFKYKQWNNFGEFGQMNMYIADSSQPFGSGKTINVTALAKSIYNKYDGKMVYNERLGKWQEQKIVILSNYKLVGIPYVELHSHQQIVEVTENTENTDDEYCNVYLVLIDEMGSQFNNRSWKDNLSEDLLSAILQQRKNKVAILGTVQDYSLFDATLRKLCTKVYVCRKRWRFCRVSVYFAKDVERADGNLDMLKCQGRRVIFASDSLYNSYDTNEKVGKLVKEIADGDRLTNQEILEHANGISEFGAIEKIRKKYKGRVKR